MRVRVSEREREPGKGAIGGAPSGGGNAARMGGRLNGTVYLLRLPGKKTRAGQMDARTWTHAARRQDKHEDSEPTRENFEGVCVFDTDKHISLLSPSLLLLLHILFRREKEESPNV